MVLTMTYSPDLRLRVISYIENGGTRLEASRLYNVARKTIYNWSRPSPSSLDLKRTRKRKIDKALLAAHIRDFPDALLRERAAHFKVNPSAVWRSLKRLDIVKKNDTLR
jgi:putative transposase